MAYVDEGDGDAIVFAHGNPTSSYLWRNVMPHLDGLGRLVACDMIGMGGSDKLHPSGPDRYHYAEQRDYLFALWDALDLGDNLTLVLHDWGSVLGFDWARTSRRPGSSTGTSASSTGTGTIGGCSATAVAAPTCRNSPGPASSGMSWSRAGRLQTTLTWPSIGPNGDARSSPRSTRTRWPFCPGRARAVRCAATT